MYFQDDGAAVGKKIRPKPDRSLWRLAQGGDFDFPSPFETPILKTTNKVVSRPPYWKSPQQIKLLPSIERNQIEGSSNYHVGMESRGMGRETLPLVV